MNTHDLKMKFPLFHRFIAYNVIPKKGHYNQVTTMDSFIIFRSTIGRLLNLNYLILRDMVDVKRHKFKALPFGALLTKIFEHFRVSIRNQHDQHIDRNFTEHLISRGISLDTIDNKESEEEEGDEAQSREIAEMDVDNSPY